MLAKDKNAKTCYISLNKTASTLTKEFKKAKLPTGKIIFVDGITRTVVGKVKDKKNIYFIDMDKSLNSMLSKIKAVVKKTKPKRLVFDSLSVLSVYHKQPNIAKFMHKLSLILAEHECEGIFLIAANQMNSKLVDSLSTMIDREHDLRVEEPAREVGLIKSDGILMKIVMGDIVLCKAKTELSLAQTAGIVKNLVNDENFFCIYITFNKPYEILFNEFKRQGLNYKNIYFFDAITRTSAEADSTKSCSFLDAPNQLDYLLVFLKNSLDLLEGKNAFLVLDSVTDMMIYNDLENTMGFLHALTNRLRLTKIGATLITVSHNVQSEAMSDAFKRFADHTVEV